MARNVTDVAHLHDVLSGYDSRYPLSLKHVGKPYAQSLKRGFKGAKVDWLGDFQGYLPLESGIKDMCEKALDWFKDIGCAVDEAVPSYAPARAWEAWLTLRNFQVGGLLIDYYKDEKKRELIKPEAIWETEEYLQKSADDVYQASKKRTNWYQAIDKLFDQFDFLVLPGAQAFPFDKNTHWLKEINGQQMDTYHQWMTVYCLVTLTGCPVINMPIGFNKAGLPMGIQIIARNQSDLKTLQMGYAFERASGFIAERNTPKIIMPS